MIKCKQLVPRKKTTFWDKIEWYKYIHWRIRYFYKGVRNIIRWMPTIYHNRDWDHSYIYDVLYKKLELQRKELVTANRFIGVDAVNKDMTLALNLLSRMREEHYSDEYISCRNNLDAYLANNKLSAKHAAKKYGIDPKDKVRLALFTSAYKQEKCDRIFWKLLHYKLTSWWD